MRASPLWAGTWRARAMEIHKSARTIAAMLSLAASRAGGTAIASDIDYDKRRAAALRPCDDLAHRGRAPQARECYGALLRNADPLIRAEAQFGLGDIRAANEVFREAVAANQRAVLPRVRWGRMFMEAGQYNDALALLQEAIELDEKDVGARLAMTRLSVERFEGDVSEGVAELLKEDPELIEAHLAAATIAIEGGRYDEAVRAATRA